MIEMSLAEAQLFRMLSPPDFSNYIEVAQMERQRRLPPLLGAHGVQYVTMTSGELGESMDPSGHLDFVSFLKDKFGIEDEGGHSDHDARSQADDDMY
jgi:hypothetical protein